MPGWPPGWELAYQVRAPRVQARLSRSAIVDEAGSWAWPSQMPGGVPMPGFTHGSPRLIALLTAWSGSPAGHAEV